MKQAWIKALLGKLAATGTMLLFLVLVPATASGELPVWTAVVLGVLGVVLLNAACGVLLPAEEQEKTVMPQTVSRHSVQLRVVRGGRAA